jgi:hypothetical protein
MPPIPGQPKVGLQERLLRFFGAMEQKLEIVLERGENCSGFLGHSCIQLQPKQSQTHSGDLEAVP